MRKKCLGCGKVFKETISVCTECRNIIDNVRKNIHLEAVFKKETFLRFRKIMSGIALLLFGIYSLLIIKILGFFLRIFSLQQVIVFFYPSIVILFVSFFWGAYVGKRSAKTTVRLWSDKDWYSLNLWGRIKNKFLFRELILLFILPGVIITCISFLFFYFDNAIITRLFYNMSKNINSILIVRAHTIRFFTSAGFILGLFFGSFFYSDWVAKLSK